MQHTVTGYVTGVPTVYNLTSGCDHPLLLFYLQAAGVCRPLVSTVIARDADQRLTESLDRSRYFNSEMPQAFQVSVISSAYDQVRLYDVSLLSIWFFCLSVSLFFCVCVCCVTHLHVCQFISVVNFLHSYCMC